MVYTALLFTVRPISLQELFFVVASFKVDFGLCFVFVFHDNLCFINFVMETC